MSQASDAHRVKSLGFYAALALMALLAYWIVRPFLVEIGWAVVLTICLAPVQASWSRRLGAKQSAALLTLLVLVVLVVPLLLVAQTLVRQGSQVVDYVDAQLTDRGGPMGLFRVAWQWLHGHLPFLPDEQAMIRQLADSLAGIARDAAGRAGHVVAGAVAFVFGLVIMLCTLFFMLRDAPKMARGVRRLLPFGREQNDRLLTHIRDIVSTSVTSTLVIAVIQGALGILTFLALGVSGSLLWGCMMAVLSLLPPFGAAVVWAPAAIWLAFSGSIVKGVILAVVGVLVISNVDTVVRPLMLSGSARMSTLVLIISLLGGVGAFGFIGIVLGPVVAAVLTALVETYALSPDEELEAPPAESGASHVGAGPVSPA
jgi:predicted PurR-regulated permease PerM